MARARRSLQDLIRSRQQSAFFGRYGQIAQYQENLAFSVEDERRRFLFNVHGDAGVGKTYLTKQLQQAAFDKGCLTAYIDETVYDPVSAMIAIAEELARSGARLGEFEKRVAAYRERRYELEADPNAPDGVATFLTKAAVTIGFSVARDVPIAGNLLAPVDVGTAADQVDRARIYLARKFGDHADVRLLLSPVDELTPVFISGIERAAVGRPVALFIDTYERTGPLLDRWLRRVYDGQYGELPESFITTISGQNPLNPNLWSDYLPVIADIPLEPFSEAEARQFLASKNIHNESLIQVILTLSGHLPMWLATLADARPIDASGIGDPADDAVGRFLKWEDDPAKRSIAMAAALPRTLNQDVLSALVPSDKARELFSWLCGLPFVTRRAGSWEYHGVVRAAMLRLQLAQAPSEWRSVHNILADANGRWARNATGSIGDPWANPNWIDHTREQIYHLLCADPINNLSIALASAIKAAQHSMIRARQWAEVIANAGGDADNATLLEWGKRLSDGINDSDLTNYLTYLINDGNLDKSSLAVALKERGEDHRLAKRYDEAVADYNRAVEIDPYSVLAIVGRGVTYRLMGRYDEALADYNGAIELDPSNSWVIIGRGVTHQLAERYENAFADYNRAVEVDPYSVLAIVGRGDIHRLMGRYDQALADFNRAIELDPLTIIDRGEMYRLMGRYDQALADYNRAVELDPSSVQAIIGRAAGYRLMGRYDEALADYNRAIELDPSDARAIIGRGETWRLMGRYDQALADLTRGIELDPGNALANARRGETYRLMGRYDDALADYCCAVELDPDNAWAIARRGVAYGLMGRYDQALADLAYGIELDPDNAWAIASRGETYRLMGRHDQALADLAYGIELDPDNAWAIASRGETYRLMGRYDEALADYNRAIELDPSDARAIASRGETYRLMGRHDQALADLAYGIELDPDNAWAIASRGETYRLMGRYDEALADYNRAIELDPDNTWDIVSRGETYRLMGLYDEALADYDRAVELDPNNVRAITGRDETYRLMGRDEKALADPKRYGPNFTTLSSVRPSETTRRKEVPGRRATPYDSDDLSPHSNSFRPFPARYDEALSDYRFSNIRGFRFAKRRRRSRTPPTNTA